MSATEIALLQTSRKSVTGAERTARNRAKRKWRKIRQRGGIPPLSDTWIK